MKIFDSRSLQERKISLPGTVCFVVHTNLAVKVEVCTDCFTTVIVGRRLGLASSNDLLFSFTLLSSLDLDLDFINLLPNFLTAIRLFQHLD